MTKTERAERRPKQLDLNITFALCGINMNFDGGKNLLSWPNNIRSTILLKQGAGTYSKLFFTE